MICAVQPVKFFVRICISKVRYCTLMVLYLLHFQGPPRSERHPSSVPYALSTSGNSKNVVNAVKTAKAIGIPVISMTGENDSLLSELSDVTIRMPKYETYKVQELHLPVYHYLCVLKRKVFFRQVNT